MRFSEEFLRNEIWMDTEGGDGLSDQNLRMKDIRCKMGSVCSRPPRTSPSNFCP